MMNNVMESEHQYRSYIRIRILHPTVCVCVCLNYQQKQTTLHIKQYSLHVQLMQINHINYMATFKNYG